MCAHIRTVEEHYSYSEDYTYSYPVHVPHVLAPRDDNHSALFHSSTAFSSKQPSHRIYLLWYYLVKVNVDDGGRRFEVCLKFLSGCANQRVFGLYGLYTFTVFIEFKLANSKTAAGKSQILQKPHASTQRYCKHFHWDIILTQASDCRRYDKLKWWCVRYAKRSIHKPSIYL